YPCDVDFFTVDVDADGRVEIVVPGALADPSGDMVFLSTYYAVARKADGTWEDPWDTQLPVLNHDAGGHVVFADVNGDGLPDAIESGLQDNLLGTWLNTGRTFAVNAGHSLGDDVISDPTTHFGLAVPLDYNADGLEDLLVPVLGLSAGPEVPAW